MLLLLRFSKHVVVIPSKRSIATTTAIEMMADQPILLNRIFSSLSVGSNTIRSCKLLHKFLPVTIESWLNEKKIKF